MMKECLSSDAGTSSSFRLSLVPGGDKRTDRPAAGEPSGVDVDWTDGVVRRSGMGGRDGQLQISVGVGATSMRVGW